MGIGQDVTVGTDDETGTERAALEFARLAESGHPRLAGNKTTEELVHRVVLVERQGLRAPSVATRGLCRADVYHRRPLFLDQFGKVRQSSSLGVRQQRETGEEDDRKQLCHGTESLLSVSEIMTRPKAQICGRPAESQDLIDGRKRGSSRERKCARRKPHQPASRPPSDPPIAPISPATADPPRAPTKSPSSGTA